jgi:hypothetical protein
MPELHDLTDLEHTFAVLEARADMHPLRDLTAPGFPRPKNSHRAGLIVAAGLTVAAVAVVAVVLGARSGSNTQHRSGAGSHSHAAPQPATTHRNSAPTTAATRSGNPASQSPADWSTLPTGHYLVVAHGISGAHTRSVIGVGTPETAITGHDTYQEDQIISSAGGFVVKVNQVGTWQPDGGHPTTVDGRPASYGSFLLHPEIEGHPVPPRTALAWQYAPNAWATVASMSDAPITLATARQIESQLQITVGDEIASPPPQGR